MIYTIVSLDDVFYVKDNATAAVNCVRSSNPYDYIRDGFYLDNAMNGEKIMSVLTAIFQAIGQAISWVLPISESGHSAIFHNFSGRFTNACSQLTGVVHIV